VAVPRAIAQQSSRPVTSTKGKLVHIQQNIEGREPRWTQGPNWFLCGNGTSSPRVLPLGTEITCQRCLDAKENSG
jgi:hypothetical protein